MDAAPAALEPSPTADPSSWIQDGDTRVSATRREQDSRSSPLDSDLEEVAPYPLPHEFTQSLARLEQNSKQIKLYLDSVEEKIARMEPRLDEMRTAAPAPPAPAESPSTAATLPATPELERSTESAPPPIDHRRRRNDVPEERRRSPFAPPVALEPEDPWSLRLWLRDHRRWAPVALLGPVALAGLLFWNPRPHPTPALPAATPAPAPGVTNALTSPKTPAGTPLNASTSPASTSGDSAVGSPRTAPETLSNPVSSTRAANPDPSTVAQAPTTDHSDASDALTLRPTETPANSPVPSRATHSSAVPAPGGKLHVSSGVMAANLISSRPPVYPGGLAGIFHIEGTVIMQAIISRNGRVVNLRVISGHRVLRGAARDAVSTWRYRPYTVNGNPVEVATIVSVDFHR